MIVIVVKIVIATLKKRDKSFFRCIKNMSHQYKKFQNNSYIDLQLLLIYLYNIFHFLEFINKHANAI